MSVIASFLSRAADNMNKFLVFQLEFETKKEFKAKRVKNGMKRLKLAEETNDMQVSGAILP